jgi:hypothetical protein
MKSAKELPIKNGGSVSGLDGWQRETMYSHSLSDSKCRSRIESCPIFADGKDP